MPLFELRNVSKTYDQGSGFGKKAQVTAVSEVSCTLKEGECLAIVGPSGSGKSTLGRLALGLEKPSTGGVFYKGENIFSLQGEKRREARRNIQVVFQNSYGAVNPRFTAREVIGEPFQYFEKMRGKKLEKNILEVLHKVGLKEDILKKMSHSLSGGELQRVCLARAIALQPKVIVLDEAVSSLDMLNQNLILELLEAIKKRSGTAYFFISHDLRVVDKVADSLAVMMNGKIVCYSKGLSAAGEVSRLERFPVFRGLVESVLPELPE